MTETELSPYLSAVSSHHASTEENLLVLFSFQIAP